jgi:beta-glucosidase
MTVYMDAPQFLRKLKDKTAALYADFGINDCALLDVVPGKTQPSGHVPISMRSVTAQKSDAPHDSLRPLYPFGYSLQ